MCRSTSCGLFQIQCVFSIFSVHMFLSVFEVSSAFVSQIVQRLDNLSFLFLLSDLICLVLSDCTWSCLDLSWSDLYRSINWGSLSYPVLSYPILSFLVLCIWSLSTHPSIYPSIYLSIFPFTYHCSTCFQITKPFYYLSICPSTHPSDMYPISYIV